MTVLPCQFPAALCPSAPLGCHPLPAWQAARGWCHHNGSFVLHGRVQMPALAVQPGETVERVAQQRGCSPGQQASAQGSHDGAELRSFNGSVGCPRHQSQLAVAHSGLARGGTIKHGGECWFVVVVITIVWVLLTACQSVPVRKQGQQEQLWIDQLKGTCCQTSSSNFAFGVLWLICSSQGVSLMQQYCCWCPAAALS